MRTATILASTVILALTGALLAGCRSVRKPVAALAPYDAATDALVTETAGESSVDRQAATRALSRRDDAPAQARLAELVGDADVAVARIAAFGLARSPAEGSVARLRAALRPETPAVVAAAAALGLGASKDETAAALLVELALRPEHPPEALEALFSFHRWSGHAAPAKLADTSLLGFGGHDRRRGRAALGHLARVVKDPLLVGVLLDLTRDNDAEVRRAAAVGLARAAKTPWPDADAARIVAGLQHVVSDGDPRVVVAAVRALGSYDRPDATGAVRDALASDDFNVRAAAARALGRRKAATAADDLARLAAGDPSTSVRYEALMALVAIDPPRGHALAPSFLADANEYLRGAGCDALAKAPAGDADRWLHEFAMADPHVRVRESALGAMEERKGDLVHRALYHALTAETDPVVVAVACGVAVKNGLTDLYDLIRAVPGRFPGMEGADAREGAVSALAAVEDAPDRELIAAHVKDEHPAVALTAARSLAKIDGVKDAPDPVRVGVVGARPGDLLESLAPGYHLLIDTDAGRMRVRLFPLRAPLHVAHVVAFARRGGYDGLTWHRVVPDFVIQGGCPRGDGAGGAGVSLPREPTLIPFVRGVLGMPRSSHPDSGGCQLFFMHSRAPHLDVHYTAFGIVTEGLDVIDRIDVDDRIRGVRVVETNAP